MQTMNKVRALHMKEAILILCLVLWCGNAAAVQKGEAGEQQQVPYVPRPARTSAYIHPVGDFLQAPPPPVFPSVYSEQCCYTTHTHSTCPPCIPAVTFAYSTVSAPRRPRCACDGLTVTEFGVFALQPAGMSGIKADRNWHTELEAVCWMFIVCLFVFLQFGHKI